MDVVAVLFDMDGVIVLSNQAHLAAWQAFAREQLGLEITAEMFYRTISGRKNEEALAELFPGRFSAGELARISAEKEAFYRKRFGAQVPPVPGILELLRELRSLRGAQSLPASTLPTTSPTTTSPAPAMPPPATPAPATCASTAPPVRLALATSGPPENVQFILARFGLQTTFDAVVTGNNVKRAKPDPTIYLRAAEKVGAEPSRCVVLEDAAAGVTAAKRAGMRCLAVSTSEPVDRLRAAGADEVHPDFTTVTWATLRQLLAV